MLKTIQVLIKISEQLATFSPSAFLFKCITVLYLYLLLDHFYVAEFQRLRTSKTIDGITFTGTCSHSKHISHTNIKKKRQCEGLLTT